MKKIIFFLAIIALASCTKDKRYGHSGYMESRNFDESKLEIYNSRPKNIQTIELGGPCFDKQDVKICKKCIQGTGYYAPNGNFCVSHFDYQKEIDNGLVDYTDKVVTQSDLAFVMTNTCNKSTMVIQKDLPANAVDFVCGVNPFVNESCFQTTWDNLSAVMIDGLPNYFLNWPEWTADPTDLDKNRFQFFWEVKTPSDWPEADSIPYTLLEVGWMLQPINAYGNTGLVCTGLQELRCLVRDNNTGVWYGNSQVCNASVLCDGQSDCGQGYTFEDLQYVDYTAGFMYVIDAPW